MLNAAKAIDAVKTLLEMRDTDLAHLNAIHDYYRGMQAHPAVPTGAPEDVKRLARISRVNMLKLVVSTLSQALYVDGFRQHLASDNSPVWEAWQANKFDARQIGVHRATLTYGFSYVTVLPGDPNAVIKGYTPRRLTAMYGDDDDWPIMALRVDDNGKGFDYRLYDEEAVYLLNADGDPLDSSKSAKILYGDATPHGLGITPVVRFLCEQDEDEDNDGEVAPLITLQNQIDFTTFGLLVAQHYAAFRQRYILGWTAPDELTLLKVAASRMLTIDERPDDVQVGEFEQTQLDGYIESRKESLQQLASISQTPVHELTGALINLSAEALIAAEAGQRRKIVERQTSFGESWEQVFDLVGQADDVEVGTEAQVRWRDTESRSLSALVDALGKVATQLNVPPEELWDKLPFATQADIERWKQRLTEASPTTQLADRLDQMVSAMENAGVGAADAGGQGVAAA